MEVHRRMLAQYGQSTMSQRKVYEWVERFKSGRTRVTDEGRSGRPSTSRTQDPIDRVDAMIREDRRITVSEVHICISALGPHMPYCVMIWDAAKSAQGGFQRSLLLCTSDSAWRLRPSSLDGMKKIRGSWKELSPAARHGCITMIRRSKDKAWNGGIPPLHRRRNSKDSLPPRKSC